MGPAFVQGDVACISRISSYIGGYQTGDVVMFEHFVNGERMALLKRVIATEGDSIQVLPEGVMLNGTLLEEGYVVGETSGIVDMTVPEGYVFVMGDNRERSYDSRQLGAISLEDVHGKVLFSVPIGKRE